MLHNHLRNFTSHKLAIDFYASDKTDHRADGIDKFRAGVKIRTHHRGGLVDTRHAVTGSGGTESGEDSGKEDESEAGLEVVELVVQGCELVAECFTDFFHVFVSFS